MTHYTVDYNALTPQAKHEKALADTCDYMGVDRYNTVMNTLKQMSPSSVNALALMLSIAGVNGLKYGFMLMQNFLNEKQIEANT